MAETFAHRAKSYNAGAARGGGRRMVGIGENQHQSAAPYRLYALSKDSPPYRASSAAARSLGVDRGRARRDGSGMIVAGVGPNEWIVISPPGAPVPPANAAQTSDGPAPSTVVDLTHARALIRIAGADSAKVLTKLCGINFGDSTTPNDTALRTSVARLVTEVIRIDLFERLGGGHQIREGPRVLI